MKLGILISGRGSNLQAIAAAIAAGALPAEIALVLSNRPQAPGLAWAQARGLPTCALPSAGREREEYDRAVVARLRAAGVELVCLAGYMRLLSGYFVAAFPQRILNIHPSLLPAFPGLDAQQQAIDYGVKYSGCTVHFVDDTLDGGPILLQAVVAVRDGDDAAALGARILAEEHRLYPAAIRLVAEGGYRLQGRRVLAAEGG
ncbi:MAG TPA: phosphoribosylglycinamide formyltransferase [Terriglobales bacterium]|nr:phosphoribosylglycinamide formyltransferase [Terriglobales bacterium]